MTVDLESLGRPAALESLDFLQLRQSWVDTLAGFDEDMGASLVPGDLMTELIHVGAYRELYLVARGNDETRQRFLAEAWGDGLDELGRVIGVSRGGRTDNEYRAAINAAPRAKGNGTEARYEAEAVAAHPAVQHAFANRIAAGVLEVYWTPTQDSDGAERAAAAIAVSDRLNGTDDDGVEVRLLTDQYTTIDQATGLFYPLAIHLYLEPGPDPADVIARSTAEIEAEAYIWQRGAGIPLSRSRFFAAATVEGVAKVDVIAPDVDPASIPAAYWEPSSITITHETADWLL